VEAEDARNADSGPNSIIALKHRRLSVTLITAQYEQTTISYVRNMSAMYTRKPRFQAQIGKKQKQVSDPETLRPAGQVNDEEERNQ
jgi:hypothetical protein